MKQSFTTDVGDVRHDWFVKLTVYEVSQIKRHAGVNLMEVLEDGCALLQTLSTDIELLASVLYLCVREQAEKKDVSQEDFLRGLAGDSLETAIRALEEALVEFFPTKKGQVLKMVLAKAREMGDTLLETAQLRLNNLDVRTQVEMAIASSSNSRGLSESIPIPLRSAS